MPVQKGKKNKRPRGGRGGSVGYADADDASPVRAQRSSTARSSTRSGASPVRRKWEAPLWLNLTVGPLMVVAGIWFGLLEPGAHTSSRLIMLVLYIGVGAWYLSRAYGQIQRQREQNRTDG